MGCEHTTYRIFIVKLFLFSVRTNCHLPLYASAALIGAGGIMLLLCIVSVCDSVCPSVTVS